LHQFDSAVLRSTIFCLIGGDWKIPATSEGIQSIGGDPVLTAEFRRDAAWTPMTQVDVIVGPPLVVRVPNNVQTEGMLALH
jgi:hypothetical protein